MIDVHAVAAQCGVCPGTIYQWVRDGRFKPPLHMGPRASRWPQSYVDDFIAQKIRDTWEVLEKGEEDDYESLADSEEEQAQKYKAPP